jgi:hypothetical protein
MISAVQDSVEPDSTSPLRRGRQIGGSGFNKTGTQARITRVRRVK